MMAAKQPLVLTVFGANTDVGKTLVSLGLLSAGRRRGAVSYLKPVQTGPITDAATIERYLQVNCDNLFAYPLALSPHVAARGFYVPSRQELSAKVAEWLKKKEDTFSVVETAGGPLSPVPLN